MQVLAPIGSIAATEQVRKLCEGYFLFNGLGPTKVKGVSEPVNVYEVTGLGPLRTRLQRAAGRGLTKFVGREREMEALKHAAEQAKSGRGQIVAAMAEPGVGKSRLFFEFKATSQSGWMVLEADSVSYGKASAYLPVIDLLRSYFRIASEDDERTRREKVTGRVVALDRSLEDTLPYLFSLLGIVEGDDPLAQMDGQIKKRRTLEAIKRILLRESLNQPLMVIFEDLHWIDEQTQDFLNLLADSIGTAKILLLVNYRPEYSHQWNSKTYYTQLRLDPLGKERADEMLSALLGTSPASATQSPDASRERSAGDLQVAGRVRASDSLEGLKRLIIDRTEGNPFFMEETVQVLLDEGALVRDGVAVRLTKPLSDLKIPPTVQAILAARIDRLPADEKDLLQVLAVIGKEFSVGIAKRLVEQPADELDRMLGNLQLEEFIYEQPAVGDVEYTFKHALTQQVAYNSVLLERRKVLHESIGRAIESLFGEGRDEHLEELAHHYSLSSNSQKAAHYLRLAAQQATLRSAYSEAIVQLNEALGLLRNLPASHEGLREELATELVLAGSLVGLHGPGTPVEAERSYLRAREIATHLGDNDALLRALFGLRLFYRFRLELEKSRALGEEELASANLNTPDRLGTAHHGLAETLLFLGEFEQARHHQAQAQILGESARNTLGLSLQPVVLVQSAWTLWILGYPSQALGLGGRALALARKEGHAGPIAVVLLFLSRLHQWVRDQPAVMKRAEESLTLADAQGTPFFSASATALRGWALAEEGRTREGLVEMRQSMAAVDEAGWPIRTFEFAPLAEVCGRIGETGAGLALNKRALQQVSKTGERVCEAELHRIRGELLLIENAANVQEAERSFRSAIEIAQRQKAKSWELRATMSLARLLAKQGRRDEARTMLAEIYGWFTEGFDTADLKDAKALLDQ
jgi:predicted ATPase